MTGLLERAYNAKWLILGISLVLLLLWIMRPFLDVFVYAIFVYYITRPIKRKVQKYIKNDVSPSRSACLCSPPDSHHRVHAAVRHIAAMSVITIPALRRYTGWSVASRALEFSWLQQNLTSGT
jgi:hypothetical protein